MTSEEKLTELVGAGLTLKQIKIGRFDINYAVAGAGPALLLLHWANIGWGQWHLNIPELAKHFTVYAPDLPGAGRSTEINFRTCDLERDFVDTIHRFITALGLKTVSIVGHSLGGWIALRLALREKKLIDKLILASPMGLSRQIPRRYKPLAFYFLAKLIAKTVMRPTRSSMENFLKSVLIQKKPVAPELIDYFYEAVRVSPERHPLFLISRLSSFWKMSPELVLLNTLHNTGQPVLIISGKKDPIISSEDLKRTANLFPNAELEIFPDVGHVPPMEAAAAFNRRVADFIRE